jgi:ATP-binding cassette subfamily F protein 3
VQGHLGAFGFSGDEVQRSTSTLSGGERSRVALAMITLGHANLLVLDEPTNHLDVESIESLEDAIDGYEGTVILVSHDRAFLRELATRVWAFDGQRLDDFHGPFVEWETRRAERRQQRAAQSTADAEARKAADRRTAASTAPVRHPAAERRARERAAAETEQAAAAAEARLNELQTALADPALYDGTGDSAERAAGLARQLSAARAELDAAIAAWSEASEALGG